MDFGIFRPSLLGVSSTSSSHHDRWLIQQSDGSMRDGLDKEPPESFAGVVQDIILLFYLHLARPSRATCSTQLSCPSLRVHPFQPFRDLRRQGCVDLLHPRGFVVVQRTDGVDFLHSTLLAKFHLRKPAPGRLLSKPASRIEMASSVKECLSSFSFCAGRDNALLRWSKKEARSRLIEKRPPMAATN